MVYTVQDDSRIYDESGCEVSLDDARNIINQLERLYPARAYVYVAKHSEIDNLYKIGVTGDLKRRESEIDGTIIRFYEGSRDAAFDTESYAHRTFTDLELRSHSEWFWLDRLNAEVRSELPNNGSCFDFNLWVLKACIRTCAKYIEESTEMNAQQKRDQIDALVAHLREIANMFSEPLGA